MLQQRPERPQTPPSFVHFNIKFRFSCHSLEHHRPYKFINLTINMLSYSEPKYYVKDDSQPTGLNQPKFRLCFYAVNKQQEVEKLDTM